MIILCYVNQASALCFSCVFLYISKFVLFLHPKKLTSDFCFIIVSIWLLSRTGRLEGLGRQVAAVAEGGSTSTLGSSRFRSSQCSDCWWFEGFVGLVQVYRLFTLALKWCNLFSYFQLSYQTVEGNHPLSYQTVEGGHPIVIKFHGGGGDRASNRIIFYTIYNTHMGHAGKIWYIISYHILIPPPIGIW